MLTLNEKVTWEYPYILNHDSTLGASTTIYVPIHAL